MRSMPMLDPRWSRSGSSDSPRTSNSRRLRVTQGYPCGSEPCGGRWRRALLPDRVEARVTPLLPVALFEPDACSGDGGCPLPPARVPTGGGRMSRRAAAGRRKLVRLMVLASVLVAGLAVPQLAWAGPNPPGNNGTVKIDDVPFDDHPNSEPHVGCAFQVDFYGYDQGDLNATVTFEAHPPTTAPATTRSC